MNCVPAKSLLESYLDDELDAAQTAHVAEHLASCASCAAVHAQLLELRAGIRAHAPYYRAPAGLRERIQVSVRQADRQATRRAAPFWRWMAIAAAILLAVSAAWNIALFHSRTSRRGSDRAGRLIEPHAIADGSTPFGRAFVRPAHGKAVVQWQAGLLAGRQRLRGSRLSLNWRADRLRERPSGGGPRVPAA